MSGDNSSERVLIRLSGDLTTKARATRRYFVRRLVKNLKDALKSEGARARVVRTHDRLFVDCDGPPPVAALSRVFGIQSLSRVEQRAWRELDDLVAAGLELFGSAVQGKRYSVRARRVGDRSRISVQSRDLERALGRALGPGSGGVDLGDPEVTARVEIMPAAAYFYADSSRGRGGLPLGVEGRAVALVSGGFDSAVAAWQMLKRGVALDYVFCNLGGRSHQLGTLRVIKQLADGWSYGTRPRFHAIDFEPVAADLQRACEPRYWQILLKRQMLRVAEQIAAEREALAIVTGEAVGQVSSQTLQNLAVISEATALPILRPLVGSNKDEIIGTARDIRTYELSKVVREYCAMVPRRPATAASLAPLQAAEAKLDSSLLERVLAERSVFDLRTLDLGKLELPELEVTEIPEDATLIDLRSTAAYRAWHYPGALHLDFGNAMRSYRSFERERSYILYCEFGLKSAHLAELMRREGIDALHFKRGLVDLLRYCRERGLSLPDLAINVSE